MLFVIKMAKLIVIFLAAVISVAVAFPAEIEDPNTVVRTVRKADPQFGGLYVGIGGYNRYGGYGYGGYPGGYGYGGYPGYSGYGHHHHHHGGYNEYHGHGGYGGHHHGGGHHHHH